MSLSPAEAIRIYDVSKPTLYKDMNNGTVSYVLDDKKKRKLNPAELDRIYQKKQQSDVAGQGRGAPPPASSPTARSYGAAAPSGAATDHSVPFSVFKDVTEQQKGQYESQIKILENALNKAQDITLLLEDKRRETEDTGQGAWVGELEKLKTEISNDRDLRAEEREIEQEKRKKMVLQYKALQAQLEEKERELQTEKKKSFLQRLIG
jgi:hypothetical protein